MTGMINKLFLHQWLGLTISCSPQATEQADKLKEQQRTEERENVAEIFHIFTSDMMTECAAAAVSEVGGGRPPKVLTDRWKGMNPEQIRAIHREREAQCLQKQVLVHTAAGASSPSDRSCSSALTVCKIPSRQTSGPKPFYSRTNVIVPLNFSIFFNLFLHLKRQLEAEKIHDAAWDSQLLKASREEEEKERRTAELRREKRIQTDQCNIQLAREQQAQ